MKTDITFDKRAEKYDGFEGRFSKRFYKNLINSVEVSADNCILDVGCGTGTVLLKLSQKSSPIKGFGIDESESMIGQARKKCPEMQFKTGDCGALPFEDYSMDIVTACMAYHHFPDQQAFRQEAFRVLKPGGKLYICDPRFPVVVRKVLGGIFHLSSTNSRFYKPEEMKADFQASGFQYVNAVLDAYVQVLILQKK